MEDQKQTTPAKRDVLQEIRERPAMILGKQSLTALAHFLDGYFVARRDLGIEPAHLVPLDFHDWVAYRLHFVESTSGFARMILNEISDEAKALDRFFELLDEYSARKPTVVARIRCHPQGYKIKKQIKYPDGQLTDWFEVACAEEVSIVTFTNDPGFFIVNDDSTCDEPRRIEFRYSLSWTHVPYRPDPEFTTVLDQAQFDRLRREAAAIEKARQEAGRYQDQIPDRDRSNWIN